MENKYKEIMSHVQVDEAMRSRILANLRKEAASSDGQVRITDIPSAPAGKKAGRRAMMIKLAPAIAAAVALLIGGVLIFGRLNDKDDYTTDDEQSGNRNTYSHNAAALDAEVDSFISNSDREFAEETEAYDEPEYYEQTSGVAAPEETEGVEELDDEKMPTDSPYSDGEAIVEDLAAIAGEAGVNCEAAGSLKVTGITYLVRNSNVRYECKYDEVMEAMGVFIENLRADGNEISDESPVRYTFEVYVDGSDSPIVVDFCLEAVKIDGVSYEFIPAMDYAVILCNAFM